MNTKPLFDVIVVGAGPAGSTLSAQLGKKGFKVLLLDKAEFPRYKVCGGGITLRAASMLRLDVKSVIRDKITQIEFKHDGKDSHCHKSDFPFIYTVMRDEFDNLLVNEAIKAGVQFLPSTLVRKVELFNEKVCVSTNKESYYGKFVVGSDGVNSVVAKQLNLMNEREAFLALEYELLTKPEALQKHKGKISIDYGIVPDGYSWIFPKNEHLSVGIIGNSKDGKLLQRKLSEYMEREQLSGSFLSQKGFFVSKGGNSLQITKGRGALVGDAAGLVDPLAGEGIYYAIWSAKILGEVLQINLKHNEKNLLFYQERVEQEINVELKLLQRISKLFYSNSYFLHRQFVKRPVFFKQFVRVTANEISYLDYYKKYRKRIWYWETISRFISRLNR
ncbi:geranylgeranyl reductase family protein [Evansella vedderi]|uniref:Geranylgeranyl reductase family protein n=1 Tax=Evansella vedderi TaxID=38282 RepID=A0ABT9ZZY7_9BACI|nr:NAD(P)/FAD-dependent oxidoreductase [Evansella vedderi]MDQ0256800.1 geranylgeranyl reductase family protein [Evansella vedderi]